MKCNIHVWKPQSIYDFLDTYRRPEKRNDSRQLVQTIRKCVRNITSKYYMLIHILNRVHLFESKQLQQLTSTLAYTRGLKY